MTTFPFWPEPPGGPDQPSPGRPDEPGYPYPPMRPSPRRQGPLMVPVVDLPGDDPAGGLFARRQVLISGPLDADTTTRVAAELMALDGRSSDVVELVVNSGGGRLADVVPLLDVIALMRAPVSTLCLGRATGTAAVLVACGTARRRAATHAVMSLRCHEPEQVHGPPDTLRQQLEELELVRRHLIALLARATGRPADELSAQLDDGGPLDRSGAAALGLIDPVDQDPAAPDQPNR